MNAKEAREMAEKSVSVEDQITIDAIEITIKAYAEKGQFSFNYYNNNISEVVRTYFEKEGFNVEYQEQGRGDYSYRFKW